MTIFYWIVEYVASYIEIFASFCFCYIFIPYKKNNNINHIICTIIAFVTIILNYMSLVSIIHSIFILTMLWLSQFYVRKKYPIKLFWIILLYFCFNFIIDTILYSFISNITNIPVNTLIQSMTIQRTAVVLTSKTILLIFCSLFSFIKEHDYKINLKASVFLCISTIFITFTSAIIYLQSYSQQYNSHIFMVIFFFILIAMIIIIYFSVINIMKSEHQKREIIVMEQQTQLISNHLKEQEETFNLLRKSIHDYKHKLLALESLMKNKKYDNVLTSIEDELKIFADKAFYINSGNNTVDIVLNSKVNVAESRDITITVNAKITNEIKIDDIDLSVILGNLIDNAIEAATKENEEKYVHIQISQIKEMLVIKILNSFSKDEISYESTKNNSELHGIGLKSVKHIVDSYNGNFTIELKDGCVIALVTV